MRVVFSSPMSARSMVLIVADDDADCRELVTVLNHQPAYKVVGPLPAPEALRFCDQVIPAVVLVHADLRDITAAEFCGLLRGRANGTRFSSLRFGPVRGADAASASAVGHVDECVSQSDRGAVSARLETLARDISNDDDRPVDQYRGRHLQAQFKRVEVIVDGVRIDLTPRELALLRFLVTHTNRVLGRADVLGQVWHNENDGRSRTVDVHIRRLRMKLGVAGTQIQTVPGVGYRFTED
jgi:DNA-binding response OmpR family regulator